MDKELENLLDNYENAIYGQAFPIAPSIHQLHLLLDYIANLEQQVKKQKEVIDKAYELIKQHIRKDGFLELNEWQTRDLLDILNEASEWK